MGQHFSPKRSPFDYANFTTASDLVQGTIAFKAQPGQQFSVLCPQIFTEVQMHYSF
jgi:hypothetical protein